MFQQLPALFLLPTASQYPLSIFFGPISVNSTPIHQKGRILDLAIIKIFFAFLKDFKSFHTNQIPVQVLVSTCYLAFLLEQSAEFLEFVEFHFS
jgi:hypothetical protein